MSIFVVFALVGLGVFLIAILTRPPEHPRKFASLFGVSPPFQPSVDDFGAAKEVSKSADSSSFKRWLALVTMAAIALPVPMVGLYWVAISTRDGPQSVFMEFIGSRYAGSALFGLLFGVLFGYWICTVFFREREKPATYAEKVSGFLMGFMLLLGFVGQEAITTAFSRLTSLEAAGVKLGFTAQPSNDKGASSLSNSAVNVTPSGPPDQSSGLNQLVGLSNTIDRDSKYAMLIANSLDKPRVGRVLERGLDTASKAASTKLKPLADCLASYVAKTGDDERVGSLLQDLAAHLRIYVRNSGISKAKEASSEGKAKSTPVWEATFWKQVDALPNEALVDGVNCESYKPAYLPEPSDSPNGEKPSDFVRASFFDSFDRAHWKNGPYLTLTYSSMIAFNHQYPAAIEALSHWLLQNTTEDLRRKRILHSEYRKMLWAVKQPIFQLRVRSAINTYVEEWQRGTHGTKTRSVNKYQLDNLGEILALFENVRESTLAIALAEPLKQIFLEKSTLVESKFQSLPLDSYCVAPYFFDPLNPRSSRYTPNSNTNASQITANRKTTLRLIYTYLTMKLLWANVALDNLDYFGQYSAKAQLYVSDLLRTNFSCLQGLFNDEVGVAVLRAEIFDAFARVQIANRTGSEHLVAILSADETRNRLSIALAAVELGQKVIEGPRQKEIIAKMQKGTSQPDEPEANGFLDKIAPTQIEDTYDSLKRTDRQLRDVLSASRN